MGPFSGEVDGKSEFSPFALPRFLGVADLHPFREKFGLREDCELRGVEYAVALASGDQPFIKEPVSLLAFTEDKLVEQINRYLVEKANCGLLRVPAPFLAENVSWERGQDGSDQISFEVPGVARVVCKEEPLGYIKSPCLCAALTTGALSIPRFAYRRLVDLDGGVILHAYKPLEEFTSGLGDAWYRMDLKVRHLQVLRESESLPVVNVTQLYFDNKEMVEKCLSSAPSVLFIVEREV